MVSSVLVLLNTVTQTPTGQVLDKFRVVQDLNPDIENGWEMKEDYHFQAFGFDTRPDLPEDLDV